MAPTSGDELSALLDAARRFRDDDPDDATRAELDALLANDDERSRADLRDRFAGKLEFGTAGLRGLVGAGTNRMNRAVVIRTTAGLAAHLLATIPDVRQRGVVLGRDARRGSPEFIADTAAVLAGAGIPAHVFEGVVPTPLVAYAVRALGAAAGVMVTASHNPPAYNGYKVYADNGAQIIPPTDASIAHAIDAAPVARAVPRLEREPAMRANLFRVIGDEMSSAYYAAIEACSLRREGRDALSIVYTPMHGVGDRFAHEILSRFGFHRVTSVAEQAEPDGAFPTVKFPNPEEPGALDLALALAKKEQADLVIANDPDADRLAIAVPDRDGRFVALTGNEVGVLLGHYLLVEDPAPAKDRLVITTIVSSPLLGSIAQALGVRYEETLTGFKWIANRALTVEHETGTRFVIGYEEALGYTVGTVARDKDGIGAAAIFAELAAFSKARGETVLGRLEAIYRQFGLVVSRQHNVTRTGSDGAARIKREMTGVRSALPKTIAGENVVATRDYLVSERRAGDSTTKLDLPASDVLAFELEGGSRITMRPSGTEPKIKYYFDVREPVGAGEPFEAARARAISRLDALEKAFVALAAEVSA
jgi:phosphomannomutase